VSGLTLTIGAATGIYSVAGPWTSQTASFTLTGVYNGTTITKIYKITKSKAGTNGVDGDSGDSVDIVFVRSATIPAIPTASTGTPTAPITWYTTVAAANTAGGIVNPLYSSTGLKTASIGNYTWDTPVRIDGTAVAEVTVFVRSATAPATPTTGGTYTFSTPPVVVAPTAPIAWSTSVPIGTNPVYTSRAVVSTSATNTAAVAISGWSTPVISLQNGADGAQGPTVQITTNRTPTFVSNDDTLIASQANIVCSLILSGITATSYAWTFYVDGATTASVLAGVTVNAATCTITQANFSAAGTQTKALKIICIVNGIAAYTDYITIVRLDNSTAAAGATVGADSTNLNAALGANILANSGFVLGTDHWTGLGYNLAGWTLDGLQNTAYSSVGTYATSSVIQYGIGDSFPVIAGERYEFSVYTGAHRCIVDCYMEFFNSAGTNLGGQVFSSTTNASQSAGGTSLAGYKRLSNFATIPATATTARIVLRKGVSNTVTVGSLVVTTVYYIQSLGTTTQAQWNTITGVASSTHAVGETFTCANAGVGFGTGTVYESSSYGFFCLPFIGGALATQTGFSKWVEGSSGSTKQITSANASTYIANAAIGSAQIGSINLVGNFNVASATTGQRMTMDSTVIKVYDSANVLRVKLGNLA